MRLRRKIKLIAIVGLLLLISLIKIWPLPLEPQIQNSLKLYANYILGERTKISDLLGPIDVACAIGPYDSFDSRFSEMLTAQQMIVANEILNKQNQISSGDNRFFLVGFRGEMIMSIYVSNFFTNFSTLNKNLPIALNCIDGDGFVSPEKLNEVPIIKLIGGM